MPRFSPPRGQGAWKRRLLRGDTRPITSRGSDRRRGAIPAYASPVETLLLTAAVTWFLVHSNFFLAMPSRFSSAPLFWIFSSKFASLHAFILEDGSLFFAFSKESLGMSFVNPGYQLCSLQVSYLIKKSGTLFLIRKVAL